MQAVRTSAIVLCAVLLGIGTSVRTPASGVRTVKNNVLVSAREPKVTLRLPQTMHYVGTDRWVLYGIANCELYAFVDTDAQKNVRRLYWVQFEGYIPQMPKLQHQYDSPRHANLGGKDFFVDTWVESRAADNQKTPDVRPLEAFIRAKGYAVPAGITSGSDQQHIEALIRAHGYVIPAELMSVRLVHLLDRGRKELMIIYSEDVATTGYTAAELRKAGKDHRRWPSIEKGLIVHAESGIEIR